LSGIQDSDQGNPDGAISYAAGPLIRKEKAAKSMPASIGRRQAGCKRLPVRAIVMVASAGAG
jgi:hypothetical protein|tara:strand:+ start:4720 stop:4905 length:186 start_codon:yes stop_codon:yes gene_type:complete